MKRLFAAVAISALTLSTAAFAADTGAVQKPVDQKAQVPAASAPAVTTPAPSATVPAKPMTDATNGKKADTVKKSDGKASEPAASSTTTKPATR